MTERRGQCGFALVSELEIIRVVRRVVLRDVVAPAVGVRAGPGFVRRVRPSAVLSGAVDLDTVVIVLSDTRIALSFVDIV